MRFLVNATPVHVPMLLTRSLEEVSAWHDRHAAAGCVMQVSGTRCLAGILEAPSEQDLHALLGSFPEHDCYRWDVHAVEPLTDVCGRDLRRWSASTARPAGPAPQGTTFPNWMADGCGLRPDARA
ncbi:hypothetical protein [Deinococcus pimensis]|uniref:hypothetical protein n=1 Tax=Deinococcus pimensis TaxID=309888 RepID=UPI00047F7B8B|nr:hypothetical protein [Deinococcus pimensis]